MIGTACLQLETWKQESRPLGTSTSRNTTNSWHGKQASAEHRYLLGHQPCNIPSEVSSPDSSEQVNAVPRWRFSRSIVWLSPNARLLSSRMRLEKANGEGLLSRCFTVRASSTCLYRSIVVRVGWCGRRSFLCVCAPAYPHTHHDLRTLTTSRATLSVTSLQASNAARPE